MDSNFPWPYGWSSSAGNRAICTAQRVIKSDRRSLREWPMYMYIYIYWLLVVSIHPDKYRAGEKNIYHTNIGHQ